MNLFENLRESAKKWPETSAIIDDQGELTFHGLYTEALNTSYWLKANGIIEHQIIGLYADNSREFIIGLFAGIACNAVVLPISKNLKEQEVNSLLDEAYINFVIGTGSFFHKAPLATNNNFSLYSISEKKPEIPSDNPAFIRFTSGTTGKAKGVVVSHEAIDERINAANEALNLGKDDRVLWVLPMAYHFIVTLCLYVKYGVGIVIHKELTAKSLVERANSTRCNQLYASPMHIKLLASSEEKIKFTTLNRIISTTSALTVGIANKFSEKYKLPVTQAFGIIEVGLPIINADETHHPGALGRALPAYTVEILGEGFEPLPTGKEGILAIKGPGMFDAYLNPPRRRQDVLKNGWFLTGDIALKEKDKLIYLKGRDKDVINVSGNKVFPYEVEGVVNLFEGVVRSKAYAHDHRLLGEIVAVDVEVSTNAEFDNEDLIAHCRKNLASFKLPQVVKVVKNIELTDSGKVRRNTY